MVRAPDLPRSILRRQADERPAGRALPVPDGNLEDEHRLRQGHQFTWGLHHQRCQQRAPPGLAGLPLPRDDAGRSAILNAVRDRERVFVYFQDKLGGEIGLSKTGASPELSFDITVVELLAASTERTLPGSGQPDVRVGKYGVIELQTTDTHGSYQHAVTALTNALDLHGDRFPDLLAANPEWAGRKIEGPNISNVFKRTFYQIAFKFQVTKRETSVGCALALPQPVWDSWQPFLGAPDLHEQADGTWRLLDDGESQPSNWIYVFDIDTRPGADGRPAPIHVGLVIGTDAATLSRAAFDVAPARAVDHGGDTDAVAGAIARRLGRYLPVA